MYKAVVLTTLLEGSEAWTYCTGNRLNNMSIMDISWQDRVTNFHHGLDGVDSVSFESLLMKAELRWTVRVIKMDSSRAPRQILHRELARGTRETDRPKK